MKVMSTLATYCAMGKDRGRHFDHSTRVREGGSKDRRELDKRPRSCTSPNVGTFQRICYANPLFGLGLPSLLLGKRP
jgi:hypothetical protein